MSLAIFEDRVEIWNAGVLPAGIRTKDLSGNHSSVQRNPLIAEVFYRVGLMEERGRGTNRVISQCHKRGIASLDFKEIAGATRVTFIVPKGAKGERKKP